MSESNRASVSLNAMPPGVLADSNHGSQEDIQIALAPYIQHYLTQTGRRHSCCSVMLPVPFERAAPKSWLDPKFDSQVLEGQYQSSVFPQLRLRFRFALLYILLCSVVWMIYFLCHNDVWMTGAAVVENGSPETVNLTRATTDVGQTSLSNNNLSNTSGNGVGPEQYWIALSGAFGALTLFCCGALSITFSEIYRRHTNFFTSFFAILLTISSLLLLILTKTSFSPLGHFSINIEIILLIYTLIPLPLWQCSTITILYSISFEMFNYYFYYQQYYHSYYLHEEGGIMAEDIRRMNPKQFFNYKIIIIRILLQMCVHLIGVHVLIMNCVRMRGTFMKVGQNLLVRRQLEMEKQLKEKMIHSVMPPKVAAMLMKDVSNPQDNDSESNSRSSNPDALRDYNPYSKHNHNKPRPSNDVKSLFRPFHMHSMDNVSILFADIVGFTRMSSTKTAEQLVEILNDLFERFDELCLINGCEKISTLGDCYYCVSGCPEPRPDHAICCVEMGLGMIQAMRIFDAQKKEDVKMRVGVHTGTVLCGIVGTRRVKFDVWSNDVTLANRMESTGVPELVHISEETCSFLGDGYIVTEGEEVFGHRTYFVHGKKSDPSSRSASQLDLSAIDNSVSHKNHHHFAGYINGMQLSKSVTNLSTIHPSVPPASPVGATSSSLNPSPVLSHRSIRIPSLTGIPKLLTPGGLSGGGGMDELKIVSAPQPKIQTPKIAVNEQLLSDNNSDNEEGITTTTITFEPPPQLPTNLGETRKRENSTSNITINRNQSKYSVRFKNWKVVPRFLFRRRTTSDPHPAETIAINKANNTNHNTLSSVSCSANSSNHCNSVAKTNKDCDSKPNKSGSKSAGRSRAGSTNELNVDQNGYQQIPVVLIECETKSSGNNLEIPKSISPRSPNELSVANCSPSQNSSIFDDIIDVRSYISQSRSDISPFGRTGSYRSQGGGGGGSSTVVASTTSHHLHPSVAGSRSPQSKEYPTIPMGRPRSSTLVPNNSNPLLPIHGSSHNIAQRHSCCASTYSGGLASFDTLHVSPSAPHSRKDSGIRSNSRRSSIQQVLYKMNNSNSTDKRQRVSDYFTSSHSSFSFNVENVERRPSKINTPHPDPLAACLQHLRKQSDLQLIRCVKDNAKSQRSYLVKPPLNNWTLFFKSSQMERDFRSKAHRFGNDDHVVNTNSFLHISTDVNNLNIEGPPTLATPRYNTYIDVIVGVLIFLTVSLSLFLLTPSTFNISYRIWVCLFALFALLQLLAVIMCSKQMCRKKKNFAHFSPTRGRFSVDKSCLDSLFDSVSNWYPWHICGGILMSLPVISILVNFSLLDVRKLFTFEYYYGFLLFICVVHFCNFTQLNCWMRNFLALCAALGFVVIIICQFHTALNKEHFIAGSSTSNSHFYHHQTNSTDAAGGGFLNLNHPLINPNNGGVVGGGGGGRNHQEPFVVSELRTRPAVLMHLNESKTVSVHTSSATNLVKIQHPKTYEEEQQLIKRRLLNDVKWLRKYQVEIYLDLILLLFLVWFLNREYEIGYRLTFYGSAVANQDKIRVQHMKNQADMLLHNIIPKHVAEHLKNTAKYSENHKDVGIIFASIVNFNEMYDESYLGGKEYLRVLNELMGDFDELLTRKEFKCVEKIKTIGSTFMAASGLDPSYRDPTNYQHLVALMDFAIAMQTVLSEFNKDLLEFNLILRIGYNIGEVTAGVIGTSKLYYDIWGDAVNVSSRMDTTGVPGRIQVGASCLPYLEKSFEFETRGSVYVKGKDNMDVYLLKAKKLVDLDENVDSEEFHNLQ